MSQVKFETEYKGKRALVQTGFDRPLNYFHFTIFDMDADDDEEDLLFDGLAHGFPRNLSHWKDICEKEGIKVPEGTWELCERREGNVFYAWDGEKYNRTEW